MSDTEIVSAKEAQDKSFNAELDDGFYEKDLTLGKMLLNRRKVLGISLEEVANDLNLRVSLLKDIEADSLSVDFSSTYSKGYIKSYASKLGLSLDSIGDLLKSEFKETRDFHNFSELRQIKPKSNKAFLFLFILTALGGGFIYFCALSLGFIG